MSAGRRPTAIHATAKKAGRAKLVPVHGNVAPLIPIVEAKMDVARTAEPQQIAGRMARVESRNAATPTVTTVRIIIVGIILSLEEPGVEQFQIALTVAEIAIQHVEISQNKYNTVK